MDVLEWEVLVDMLEEFAEYDGYFRNGGDSVLAFVQEIHRQAGL
jgi:hypothetical protein